MEAESSHGKRPADTVWFCPLEHDETKFSILYYCTITLLLLIIKIILLIIFTGIFYWCFCDSTVVYLLTILLLLQLLLLLLSTAVITILFSGIVSLILHSMLANNYIINPSTYLSIFKATFETCNFSQKGRKVDINASLPSSSSWSCSSCFTTSSPSSTFTVSPPPDSNFAKMQFQKYLTVAFYHQRLVYITVTRRCRAPQGAEGEGQAELACKGSLQQGRYSFLPNLIHFSMSQRSREL